VTPMSAINGMATSGIVLRGKPSSKRCQKHAFIVLNNSQVLLVALSPQMRHVSTTRTSYFEILCYRSIQSKSFVHVLVPTFRKEQLLRDSFWLQRSEITTYISDLGITCTPKQVIMLATEACVLVNGQEAGVSGYYDTLLDNTQNPFNEMADQYSRGEIYEPETNLLTDPHYSHTRLFSWIYFVESQWIGSIASEGRRNLRVLELGSSFGTPIYTKEHLLNDPSIEYCGIDVRNDLLSASRRFALRHGYQNMRFAHADVTKNGWFARIMAITSGLPADVVTSSHLLEHLECDPVMMIERWFRLAKTALIVSVPYSKEEVEMSDHHQAFDGNNLLVFADNVEERLEREALVIREHLNAGILGIVRKG